MLKAQREKTWEKLEIKAAAQVLGITTSGMNDYLQVSARCFILFLRFYFTLVFTGYDFNNVLLFRYSSVGFCNTMKMLKSLT